VDPEEETAARNERKKAAESKQWDKETMLRTAAAQLAGTNLHFGQQQSQNLDAMLIENMSHGSSKERDHIYGMASSSMTTTLDKLHPVVLKRDNNKTYNEYLTLSHAQRTQMGQQRAQSELLLCLFCLLLFVILMRDQEYDIILAFLM
jgi:hypothetical protein